MQRGLDRTAAADLLWNLTSLRTWEDLVLERGWSARQYTEQITRALHAALLDTERGREQR